MKKLLIETLILVFIANLQLTSVWAQPCYMHGDSNPISDEREMPCHDVQTHQQHSQGIQQFVDSEQKDHCEEFCLCLNVLVSQIPLVHSEHVLFPELRLYRLSIQDDDVISMTSDSLFRPPISLS